MLIILDLPLPILILIPKLTVRWNYVNFCCWIMLICHTIARFQTTSYVRTETITQWLYFLIWNLSPLKVHSKCGKYLLIYIIYDQKLHIDVDFITNILDYHSFVICLFVFPLFITLLLMVFKDLSYAYVHVSVPIIQFTITEKMIQKFRSFFHFPFFTRFTNVHLFLFKFKMILSKIPLPIHTFFSVRLRIPIIFICLFAYHTGFLSSFFVFSMFFFFNHHLKLCDDFFFNKIFLVLSTALLTVYIFLTRFNLNEIN